MKYEPVFGDQKRFNEQNNEMAEVMLWHDCFGPNFVSIKELSRMNLEGAIPHGSFVLAMRRIIAEPKRWTVEDQKAGRLPEVGSKAVSVHDFCVVDILAVRNRCVVVCNSDVIDSRPCVFTVDNFLEIFKPIETQDEKAARLEDEYLNAIAKHYPEFDIPTARFIYRAQFSGELPPVQAKDGE